MQPDVLDFSRRAELSELMDEPCSREVMRACLRDLARVNRWFLAYRPILKWLDSLGLPANSGPIHILDVGCGYGDGLRRIEQWASQRGIAVELTGCDLNPDSIAIASEASPPSSHISWIAADVFTLASDRPIDIVVSSLFTHHLSEPQIIRFLTWMEGRAKTGWFVNDLSRASIPYSLFKAFAKVANLHPFVQHDGPVSIARAFIAEDWRRMCAAAGLNDSDISIQSFAPARLCVARQKQRNH
jgi:2-polyprenyl-3-methyl-5-hydroxy-6-metoxy-1,4-benzoquinol methylase